MTEKTLDIKSTQKVEYCIPLWLRDEQIKHAVARPIPRIQRRHELRPEPIALVNFGPSLNDTWEKVREFRYVMTCSGAHRFLLDRGVVPTHHCEVDPRKHKIQLLGEPHPNVEYLVASTCHPDYFDHLLGAGVKVTLWHIFDSADDALRTLPHGEWSLLGGCSVGLRTMTVAHFLGFTDLHIFGMDGCAKSGASHGSKHPNAPKKWFTTEYNGVTYHTTPAMLEVAKGTWHELNQMPKVKTTFYGDGLVQAMAKDYKPEPAMGGKQMIGFHKPELISSEYRELNARLHKDNLAYGVGGGKHAELVLKIIKGLQGDKEQIPTVLDYGCGKGQNVNANVLTPTGWRRIGDVKAGDSVVGSDGKPTTVTGVYHRGVLPVFKVQFSDGASLQVDGDHLWAARTTNHQKRGKPFFALSTLELMSGDLRWNNQNWPYRPLKWRIPMVRPVEFSPTAVLPMDPYLLGVLLGDGCLCNSNVSLCSATAGLPETAEALLPAELEFSRLPKGGTTCDYRIVRRNRRRGQNVKNAIKEAVKDLGLDGVRAWNKFIPDCYLMASVSDRISLLQGLIDTDGEVSTKHTSYSTSSVRLADQIVFVVQSLGGTAKISIKEEPVYTLSNGLRKIGRPAFVVHIKLPADIRPTRVKPWAPRKKYHPNRAIESIIPDGKAEVVCISVDAPDRLYVTENFVVTHNSYLQKSLPFPIWQYDPAIPEFSEPPRPADLVVATDVLEHIEPEKLAYVLDDLRRVTRKVGYFVIHTGPSGKTLADGRNTHLIQKPPEWWVKKLKKFFAVPKDGVFYQKPLLTVVVGPKVAGKQPKTTGVVV